MKVWREKNRFCYVIIVNAGFIISVHWSLLVAVCGWQMSAAVS